MALTAPANFNQIRERKMSEENNIETFTKVPNAFLDEHLNKITHLPELKITLAVIRKTIGYSKQSDIISYSQFEEMTGMTRPSVCDGINYALERGLVTREKSGQYWKYSIKVVAIDYQYPITSSSHRLPEEVAIDYQLDQKLVAVDYPQKKVLKENIKKDKTTTSVVAATPPKSSTIDLIETFPVNQEIQPEQPSIPTDEVITQSHATYPATSPIDFTPKVKGSSAGVRGEMISSKPRDKPKSKGAGKGKEPDPNSKHPAVVIWQEIHERFPNKFQMVDIIKAIGEDPGNLAEWRECLIYYAKHPSWDQTNSGRILDCFTNQNYKKGENFGQGGNGKPGFGTIGAGTAQQGARGNGRVLGKSRAFGPDGRLTDEQLQNAW